VIAAVQIAEVIAVRKRCKKYLSEGISGDELLEEAAEERRQKKKNPRPDISLAKAKKSGTVLLVVSIVSLIAAFASLVLITFVKIWKIWAPSLGMAAFFPIPLIGLILSLVLVIYTITKGKEKPYKRTYVALGLNGASLAVILIPTIMAVGVLLRLFFTGDVLSSREIYLNNLKELHGTEFDFVGANCVASYEHPEIILEEKEAKYNQAYHRGYVAKLEEAKLQEELQQFFPGALVILNCSDIQITWQEDFDFEGTTLEENIRRAVHDEDGSVGEVQIEILIDKKIGTSQKYKSEFEYFTTKMKEYEANDQLVPVTIVTLYWVDAETIERAKEYLTHGVMKLDYNWDDNVWGFREDWHTDYSKEDLGNPPRIFGNFKKGIKNEMDLLEYTNRRRMLEASN
jgi:hypothetical protein